MKLQVNLLPWREEYKQQLSKRFLIACGTFGAIVLSGAVLWYMGIGFSMDAQNARNAYLEEQSKILDERIKDIENLKEQTRALLERKKVVENLQLNRSHGVLMLNELIKIVPVGISLKTVTEKGSVITFQGVSNSNANISQLMKSIDDSEFFTKPKLIGIQAVVMNNQRVSDFTLTAEVKEQKVEETKVAKPTAKTETKPAAKQESTDTSAKPATGPTQPETKSAEVAK